jgi:hypothetical protein
VSVSERIRRRRTGMSIHVTMHRALSATSMVGRTQSRTAGIHAFWVERIFLCMEGYSVGVVRFLSRKASVDLHAWPRIRHVRLGGHNPRIYCLTSATVSLSLQPGKMGISRFPYQLFRYRNWSNPGVNTPSSALSGRGRPRNEAHIVTDAYLIFARTGDQGSQLPSTRVLEYSPSKPLE